MKIARLHIILAFVLLGSVAFGQQVRVSSRLAQQKIRIGEQIDFVLEVKQPKGTEIAFPFLLQGDTLTKNVEILLQDAVDTLETDNGQSLLRQRYTITSFDSGSYVISALPFLQRNGDTFDTLRTQPLILDVTDEFDLAKIDTTRIDKDLGLMDIKDVRDKKFSLGAFLKEYGLYFIVALLLIATAIFYFVVSRRAKMPIFSKPEVIIPPHDIALQALNQLDTKQLWQAGSYKDYHSELTQILRTYIEARFNFPALERTSHEILRAFEMSRAGKQAQIERLSQMFTVADFVKFAKLQPTADDNKISMDNAIAFVTETIPSPVATPTTTPAVEPTVELKKTETL